MKPPSNFSPRQLIFIFTYALLFLIKVVIFTCARLILVLFEYFIWAGLIYLACHFLGLQITWLGAIIMAIIGVLLVNLFSGKSDEEQDDGQDNGSDD